MLSALSLAKHAKALFFALDLERYDYTKGSSSLIRATEGTIVERLPPRMKIREGAALELPHILVLIDDPNRTVIEPLRAAKSKLEKLYDFDLMLDSGHLTGYAVNSDFENKIVEALRGLAKPEVFAKKYGIDSKSPVLTVCDGRWQSFACNRQSHLGKDQAAGRHGSSRALCVGGN